MCRLELVDTMKLETKFKRVPLAVTVGSRFGDWQVTWIDGWDKWRLYYLVMVVKLPRQAYDESKTEAPSSGAPKVRSGSGPRARRNRNRLRPA
jgi:hypothetical protein